MVQGFGMKTIDKMQHMSGSQLTAKNRNSSPVGPLPIFCLRPTPVLHKSIVFIMPKPCLFLGKGCRSCRPMFLMEMCCLLMQIGALQTKVFRDSASFLTYVRNGIFYGHVESDTFGSTGGSGGPERKKSAQAQARKPFFGTDTRWEPVINQFHLTRHF